MKSNITFSWLIRKIYRIFYINSARYLTGSTDLRIILSKICTISANEPDAVNFEFEKYEGGVYENQRNCWVIRKQNF